MQDRYVGDLGDFGKFGMLKKLCLGIESPPEKTITLGVVWYLVPDESHNDDGKHVRYLDINPSNNRRFREGDPLLYDTLGEIVREGKRNISRIREREVLPPTTKYYDEPLSFGGMPNNSPQARQARHDYRNQWINNALEITKDCDMIFVDPDNGIEVPSVQRYQKTGPKYVFFEELQPYIKRGQSLVIYHHLCRTGSAEEQIMERLGQIKEKLDVSDRVFALLYKRGTLRTFFIIPSNSHKGILIERARYLTQVTPWNEHFSMYI